MKHSALLAILLTAGAVVQAQAADYEDTARVVSVAPRMERYNIPRQECTTDAPAASGDRSNSGAIIGRVAGAAVGAGTGAIVGDRMQNGSAQPVQRCRTVYDTQERPSGYLVTYDYHGQTLTDFMPVEPGQSVRVRVHVQAVR